MEYDITAKREREQALLGISGEEENLEINAGPILPDERLQPRAPIFLDEPLQPLGDLNIVGGGVFGNGAVLDNGRVQEIQGAAREALGAGEEALGVALGVGEEALGVALEVVGEVIDTVVVDGIEPYSTIEAMGGIVDNRLPEVPGYLQAHISPEEFSEFLLFTKEALRDKEAAVQSLVAGDEEGEIPGIPLRDLLALGHKEFGNSLQYMIENHTAVQAYMAEGISFGILAEIGDEGLKALLQHRGQVQALKARGMPFEDLCQLGGGNYGMALRDLLLYPESEESQRWVQEHTPQQGHVNVGNFNVPAPGTRVCPRTPGNGLGLL